MNKLEQMLGSCKDEMSRGSDKRGAVARQYTFVGVEYTTLGQTKG